MVQTKTNQSHRDMVERLLTQYCPDKAWYILGFVNVLAQAEKGTGWREGVEAALEGVRTKDGTFLTFDGKNPYIYEPPKKEN